ncbi:MAG: BREX-6 system BrxE protein [Leptospiraceae bacterium]|nr:BREX-6 system BrxE protein [Leptospiraceae bacterium]
MKTITYNFTTHHLDLYLYYRILVARLGESERFQWWDKNLDATDSEGGGAFFQKLLPDDNPSVGYLSAVEAPIESAKALELSRIHQANNQDIFLSLFLSPPELESILSDRWFHWKRFPNDIPAQVARVLDSSAGKERLVEEFKLATKDLQKPKFEGTSFGLKVLDKISEKNQLSIENVYPLLALIVLEKGDWVFPYHE